LVRLGDGQLLPTKFEAKWDRATQVAFDPTGRRLAALEGNDVLVWDEPTGRVLATLTLPPNDRIVLSLRFLPDGGLAVVQTLVKGDASVQVWDVPSGNLRYRVARPHSPPLRMAWFPDGRRWAWLHGVTDPPATEVTIRDEVANQEVSQFRLPTPLTPGLAFVDDRRLALPARDGTIALWDRVSGEKVRTFAGHSGSSGHLAVSPDGRRLAAVWGGILRLWDIDTGRELLTLPREGANAAAFSPDGHWIAVTTPGGVSFLDGRPGE
jgi:WD40 repeat protein